jgi:drug/metabolite transporter (DMT)-like permease
MGHIDRPAATRLALWGAVLIWGVNAHFVKMGCALLPRSGFLALRFIVATVALLVLARLVRTPAGPAATDAQGLSRTRWWLLAVAVAGLLGGFYWFQTWSLTDYSTVNAVFLTGTVVFWIPVIRSLVLGDEPPTFDTVAGVVLCLVGFLALQGFQIVAPQPGDLLALVGAVFLAGELVIVSWVSPRLGDTGRARWTNAYTGLTAVGLAAIWGLSGFPLNSERPAVDVPAWVNSWPATVMGVLFAGVVATAVAPLIANWATGQVRGDGRPAITADQRGLVENIDAPVTLLTGLLFFPWNVERIEGRHVGFLLIIAAVLTSELGLATRLKRWMSESSLRLISPASPPSNSGPSGGAA